ncbi:hypothetical protein [Methylobrevis pamukkalensis]|uniref:Uncharacterized protein n=1 Tax=Methylobrevis pamukkalensis TaxID=1439726 RepID=A0A1E3H1A8_9HYPH|nr:hypothetical protein [Methylobrevis pamukkalensis]ODN69586.1 hypothetical protein A6302_03132 [Methylobrevis pamukkalensis]
MGFGWKLPGVSTGNTSLPLLVDYRAELLAIASLVAWHEPRTRVTLVDGSNRVTRINNLVDSTDAEWWKPQTEGTALTPLVVANALNSQPVIRFADSRLDALDYNGTIPTGSTAKQTRAILVNAAVTGVNQGLLASSTATGRSQLYLNTDGKAVSAIDGPTTAVSAETVTGGWALVLFEHDAVANTVSVRVNDGTVVSTSSTADVTNNEMFMGATNANGGSPLDGDVAAVWLFDDAVISNADVIDLLLAYCDAKFGLSLAA